MYVYFNYSSLLLVVFVCLCRIKFKVAAMDVVMHSHAYIRTHFTLLTNL